MNEKVREDYYKEINDFIEENSNDPSSGDAYFAYVVALSRAYRGALSDAMKYMLKKDPDDIRIQAAFILDQVLDGTDALWEDYQLGAPVEAHPLFGGEIDCGDGPQSVLRWHVAAFPENGIGGIYGGREPEEWVKRIIDTRGKCDLK